MKYAFVLAELLSLLCALIRQPICGGFLNLYVFVCSCISPDNFYFISLHFTWIFNQLFHCDGNTFMLCPFWKVFQKNKSLQTVLEAVKVFPVCFILYTFSLFSLCCFLSLFHSLLTALLHSLRLSFLTLPLS